MMTTLTYWSEIIKRATSYTFHDRLSRNTGDSGHNMTFSCANIQYMCQSSV